MRKVAVLLLAALLSMGAAWAEGEDDGPEEERVPVPIEPIAIMSGSFAVICYHEVRAVRDYPDPFAVNTSDLVMQFAWLRENGYQPVSLDDILSARRGGKPLPAKAVLLSFDDGYRSFYTRVYPLLQAFRFPAVLGVVGKWIDDPRGAPVLTDEKGAATYASFVSWEQVREMAASGLVEIASHTYDMHRGLPANPQGNLQPAATARIHDPVTGTYESDAAWRRRVRADLARSAEAIERATGRRPRAVVWPYGSYNDELVRIARGLGMTVALTLVDGANTPEVPLTELRRTLIEYNPGLAEFSIETRGPLYAEPVRAMQVRLDDVYSPDPAQQQRNLSLLLDRVDVLRPTDVYLHVTTDSDGVADAAYFPNRHLPVRADLFNRAAWQIASRNDAKVYAVIPVNGIDLPEGALAEVVDDLARYANFDGLVFEDRYQHGKAQIPAAPELMSMLTRRARVFRAPLRTVRALYAVADSPTMALQTFSQTLEGALATFGNVALIPLASTPGAEARDAWIRELARRVTGWPGQPELRRRVIFMLQSSPPMSGDANQIQEAPEAGRVARQMRALQLGGIINFGYSPDDFAQDDPPLEKTAPVMSLRVYPTRAAGNGSIRLP